MNTGSGCVVAILIVAAVIIVLCKIQRVCTIVGSYPFSVLIPVSSIKGVVLIFLEIKNGYPPTTKDTQIGMTVKNHNLIYYTISVSIIQ